MEKNKKKTLTISGGIGKKISPPQTGKKPEKKAFNLYKKKPQGSFFKKPGQGFSKPTDKPSSRKNFSRKYMPNNKQPKDLFILIQRTLQKRSLVSQKKLKIQFLKESQNLQFQGL